MESNIISLKSLYEFVLQHPDGEGLNARSPAGRAYSKVAADIVGKGKVADTQGFYLWGWYDPKGLWSNVYLGKAGFGRTANLHARIFEELKDERCCIWRAALSMEKVLEACAQHYPMMSQQYQSGWKRSMRKAGTTHIAWVTDPGLSNEEVANIESDLIETLNPVANKNRPVPPISLQTHTRDVIAHLRVAIHRERERKYRLFVI